MESKPDGRVLFILDELQNIGRIKALDTAFAEYNSYGISFLVALQDLGKITRDYTSHIVDSMTDNCDCQIYLNPAATMVRRVRQLAGRRVFAVFVPSVSEAYPGAIPKVSYTLQRIETELVTDNHLKAMSRNRHIVFFKNEVIWGVRTPHWKMSWLSKGWVKNPMEKHEKPGALRRAWYSFVDGFMRPFEARENPYRK